ncbi:RNA-binding domain-containing protein [Coemansia reversa NRRL 1564]|uniref:RNA-binding domain-containing protein n=1 Tax=Coemansia reversa (strain ATCC 12441 / NRRL 1564) TaxID=763665 RepID=A0A2G5BD46_COERN|nr:RNA-binding domain-containing protein [Coemansia reversa NRRL 1564]|eukprot:PIA16931.1 RNA-binding domain-containing protein [Coemansia reversa NRRL 1564]
MNEKVISIAGSAPRGRVSPCAEDDMKIDIKEPAVPVEQPSTMDTTQETSNDSPFTTKSNSSEIAQRSVEGWVVVATGIHEEAREEDVQDFFADYGKVRSLHLNLDRQTGYVKGYVILEYATREEASAAVEKGSGKKLLGMPIVVDFAFVDSGNNEEERDGAHRRRWEKERHASQMDDDTQRGSYAKSIFKSVERSRELSPDRGF